MFTIVDPLKTQQVQLPVLTFFKRTSLILIFVQQYV